LVIMYDNPGDLPPSKNPEERRVVIETASKHNSALSNPCLKEQEQSYKCLSQNNYDKDKCAHFFANYTACHKFWSKVQLDRRRKGIRPFLPRPEERDRIKEEYLQKKHQQDPR